MVDIKVSTIIFFFKLSDIDLALFIAILLNHQFNDNPHSLRYNKTNKKHTRSEINGESEGSFSFSEQAAGADERGAGDPDAGSQYHQDTDDGLP